MSNSASAASDIEMYDITDFDSPGHLQSASPPVPFRRIADHNFLASSTPEDEHTPSHLQSQHSINDHLLSKERYASLQAPGIVHDNKDREPTKVAVDGRR